MAPFFQSKQSMIRELENQENELKDSMLKLEDACLKVMFKQIAVQLRASISEYEKDEYFPMLEELKSYAKAFETMDFNNVKFGQRRQELRILHGLHNIGFKKWVEDDVKRISGNKNLSEVEKNRIYLTRLADMLLNSHKPATKLAIDSSTGKIVERNAGSGGLRSELSTKGALLGMGNSEQVILDGFRNNFPTALRDNLYDVQALSALIDEHKGIRPINSTDTSNIKSPIVKALSNVWNAISFKWLRTKSKDVLEAEQKVKLASEKKINLSKQFGN